jgi:hypothetical protein
MDDVAAAIVFLQCGRDLETSKNNFGRTVGRIV